MPQWQLVPEQQRLTKALIQANRGYFSCHLCQDWLVAQLVGNYTIQRVLFGDSDHARVITLALYMT